MAAKSKRIIYSDADCHRLVDIITSHGSIVECKKTDAVTWKEKNATCDKIAEKYNSSTTEPRTSEQLRCKFDNLKKEVRRYEAAKRQMLYKTGGGIEGPDIKAVLKLLYEKIKSIISFSINGLEPNQGDSDMIEMQLDHVEEYCDTEPGIEIPHDSCHPIILNNDMQESEEIATTSPPIQIIDSEVKKDWSDYTPKMLQSRKHKLLQVKRKKMDTSEGVDVENIKIKMFNLKKQLLEEEASRDREFHAARMRKEEIEQKLCHEKLQNQKLQNEKLQLEIRLLKKQLGD